MTHIERILVYLIIRLEKYYRQYNQTLIKSRREYARDKSNVEKRICRVKNAIKIYKLNPSEPPVRTKRTIIDRQLGLYYK